MAYENLEKLARAMGHETLCLAALEQLAVHGVGAFPRLAVQHGVPLSVAIKAKGEFTTLMVQGAQMFAPAQTVVRAARLAQEVSEGQPKP